MESAETFLYIDTAFRSFGTIIVYGSGVAFTSLFTLYTVTFLYFLINVSCTKFIVRGRNRNMISGKKSENRTKQLVVTSNMNVI